MQYTKLGLLAGLAFGALVAATPAYAQVTLKVWSIDGNDRPGIADTFSKEFDEANEDIVVVISIDFIRPSAACEFVVPFTSIKEIISGACPDGVGAIGSYQ